MKEKEAGWERIAEQLIQDLRNGKYSPGDKLPSGKTGIPHCAPWKNHGTGPWGGCKRAGQVLVKSAG